MDTKLRDLLAKSAAKVASMTEMEYDQMIAAQRASWVRAEMLWPKAKFKMVGGIKVYDSYEDYCA